MQKIFILCISLFSLYGFGQNKLDVFFDFNKDVPNEASQIKINQWVLDNKSAEIIKVLGYTDSVDDSKYNKDLAMRRVNSMVEFFNKNSIKVSDKVALKSFGEDFKYSKNQSENRKVEVFYNLIKEKNPDTKNVQTIPDGPFGRGRVKEATALETKEEEDILEVADKVTLVEEERSALESKFDKAKKGDIVRINNINFYFNSERVMDESLPLLDELLDIMMNNPKLSIEIHGHICCNPNPNDTKLSYRRALVILKYLTKYGVDVKRLAFRGYGSSDPIYKIPERNLKERAANRRVEILIVNK
ncbi:OmpA family protein [Flavobacterium sp. AS60]|uniref:OmpA family protein n=1 Tax=Flavobacterium anseongense TaxID=2910677 RepID=UPI001F28E361|nr:OmpA family protein [Flavobacterium sp. AS60]MCF6130489.1 OmpA family protein [Flavobacterium sp. AS60]